MIKVAQENKETFGLSDPRCWYPGQLCGGAGCCSFTGFATGIFSCKPPGTEGDHTSALTLTLSPDCPEKGEPRNVRFELPKPESSYQSDDEFIEDEVGFYVGYNRKQRIWEIRL